MRKRSGKGLDERQLLPEEVRAIMIPLEDIEESGEPLDAEGFVSEAGQAKRLYVGNTVALPSTFTDHLRR
jgi:hypothetical protein